MSGLHVRVVKIGGSLLDLPDLQARLSHWIDSSSPALNVLLVGGGGFAETIRQADARFHLGEERAHWLCIEALGVSARLLGAIFGGRLPIQDWPTLLAIRNHLATTQPETSFTVILDPPTFLNFHEPQLPPRAIPHTWDVTTDSIAARMAECLRASELALLKSCDPPADFAVGSAASSRMVDPFFPQAVPEGLKVTWTNLRMGSGEPQDDFARDTLVGV